MKIAADRPKLAGRPSEGILATIRMMSGSTRAGKPFDRISVDEIS